MEVICSCCGKLFKSNGSYFIWNGIAIYVCREPCSFPDFVESQ